MSSKYASPRTPTTTTTDMGKMDAETEVQRAAKHQLMQEARSIRSKELERRRREEEENENGSIRPDGPSRATSSGTSRFSSQRSSIEPNTISTSSRNTDARELRNQLIILEEKFTGAMMANAQLDNDKQLLRYEVDLLKDKLEDLADSNASLQKQFLEKKRDLAYQRMQVAELNHRLDYARNQVEARDQLLTEHGLVLFGGTDADAAPPLSADPSAPNANGVSTFKGSRTMANGGGAGEEAHDSASDISASTGKSLLTCGMALLSKSTVERLEELPGSNLESRVLHLFSVQEQLNARIHRLEHQKTEEERQRDDISQRLDLRSRLAAPHPEDIHKLRSEAQENRLKYHEALQRINALESDIVRLEGQNRRYKSLADEYEKQEEKVKADRRNLQLQLRDALNNVEELKSENSTLKRKLDRATRGSVGPGGGGSTSNLRAVLGASQHR